MRRIRMIIALGMVAIAATGCTRKLRVTKYPDGYEIGHYAGDGGVVLMREASKASDGRMKPRAICVAPPAQAATTIKIEAKNGVKAAVKGVTLGLDTDNKFEESLHSLYEQGQATLYIQFMAYRLCEATLNGWLADDEYQEELTKLMQMGTMLIQLEVEAEREDSKQAKAKAKAKRHDAQIKALDEAPSGEASDAAKQQLRELSQAEERSEADEEQQQTLRVIIETLSSPYIDDELRTKLEAALVELSAK